MYTQNDINTLSSVLYNKSCTCPLCNTSFTSKSIKLGKNKLISIDEDLYAHYDLVNPIIYDILLCPECSYTALSKNFNTLLPKQKEWLRKQFYKGNIHTNIKEYTTLDEAISRHKLALLACITKKGKLSEQSYIALHIAWLYRDKGDVQNETLFITRAYNGFNEALPKENLPYQGIDEPTMIYMLAAMAHRLGKNNESKQLLSSLLTMVGVSTRLKDHALTLKSKIMNLDK